MVDNAARNKGQRAVCIREVQKTLKESAKRLIEDKIELFGFGQADGFKVFREVIQTPGDGIITFQGMQDSTAESIKSLEGFNIAWTEEAQTLSQRSLSLLRPTIREAGSELWFSWNPRRKNDPVDALLRGDELPTGATVVQANWSENPWFPDVLETERQDCIRLTPEQYDHIWDGGYATVLEGAYFARELAQAKTQGRICRFAPDPNLSIRAYWDLGGAGLKSDATSIWIAQSVGQELRVLNYYEAQGQPLATHINWLRRNGYEHVTCVLPHDGNTSEKVYAVSFETALEEAGFPVVVVPNQGRGAARNRIEAARQLFPNIWFNAAPTEPGRDALGWYHEKIDEVRQVGLGPDHDWSSHAADAFGLMCVAFEAGTIMDDDEEYFDDARGNSKTTGY